MPKTIIFLFEKFLQKTLNSEEKQLFAKLLHSEDSQKELYTYQLMKDTVTINADNQFRNLLNEIAFEYEYKSKFSHAELQQMFRPLDKYEKYLDYSTSNSTLGVKNPINGLNYNSCLHFELSTFISHQMLFKLYNNQDQEIFQQLIPPKIIYFDVPLSTQFFPGRYYWKLQADMLKSSIWGMFFIGKDLCR